MHVQQKDNLYKDGYDSCKRLHGALPCPPLLDAK